MFGSVAGSFGTFTRYADNASAVSSNGRAPSSNRAVRRPLFNRAQRGLRSRGLGGKPPQLEEIDEVTAFPPAGGHRDRTPRVEPTPGRRVHGIRHLTPGKHFPPTAHRVGNR